MGSRSLSCSLMVESAPGAMDNSPSAWVFGIQLPGPSRLHNLECAAELSLILADSP